MQRRLKPPQVEELLQGYREGVPINDLSAQFGIHRSTLLEHLNRADLPRRRYPALQGDELKEARRLYESGQSAATVAEHFAIDASTVYRTLKREGVQMRDPQGRERRQ